MLKVVICVVGLMMLGSIGLGQGGYFRHPTTFTPIGASGTGASLDARYWPFVADINGDGLGDLILSGDPVACALGQAGGGFAPFVTSPPGSFVFLCGILPDKVHDMDGDGNLDLFGHDLNGIYTFLGDGSGGFVRSLPASGFFSAGLNYDVGDVDNDGVPELIGTYGASYPLTITISKWQNGAWLNWMTLTPSNGAVELLFADLNGDGWKDVVFTQQDPNAATSVLQTWAFVNNGAGTSFSLVGPITPYDDRKLAVCDVDGDGCDDVASTYSTGVPLGSSPTLLYRGDPQSLLLPPIQLSYQPAVSGLIHTSGLRGGGGNLPRFSDVNQDGLVDWIWLAPLTGTPAIPNAIQIRVMFGLGGGAFGPPLDEDELLTPDGLTTVGFSDVDGDGDPDALFGANCLYGCGAQWAIGFNDSTLGPGAAGAIGVPPSLTIPTLPTPGNFGFRVNLSRAWPLHTAFLALSMAPASGVAPANWWLDFSSMVLPTATVGVLTTDAVGDASFLSPIPPSTAPGVLGLEVYLQWAVRDPAGPFTLAGGSTFAFSDARKVVVW